MMILDSELLFGPPCIVTLTLFKLVRSF